MKLARNAGFFHTVILRSLPGTEKNYQKNGPYRPIINGISSTHSFAPALWRLARIAIAP